MWQFIFGSDDMFEDLEQRARRACVRFPSQPMPPGTVPTMATIGIEVEAGSGRVRLLVERGTAYDGTNNEVERWISTGCRTFHDVAQLRSWLGSTLRDSYRSPSTATTSRPTSTDKSTLHEAEHELDEVGAKGLRLAMRLDCPMKDLPS